MNTKSKRQFKRSQHAARVPRHYSHLIEGDVFEKTGLIIVVAIIIFLALVVLSALV